MVKPKKFSFLYYVLQHWCVAGFRVYFQNIAILSPPKKEEIPTIYCANHQNAFIDALLIATAVKTQPASLVRADVFQSKLGGFLLRKIKMMPVYRSRDGIRSVTKNDITFNQSRDYLAQNGTLIIFPEGNHSGVKKLRPLKHGAARLAADTLLLTRVNRIKIQPIGLEYSDHPKFRSNALLRFGNPRYVTKEEFPNGSQDKLKVRHLTKEIENELKGLIYHQNTSGDKDPGYRAVRLTYPVQVLDKLLFLNNFRRAKKCAERIDNSEFSDEEKEHITKCIQNAEKAGFPGLDRSKARDFIFPLTICFFTVWFVPPALIVFGIPYFLLKFLQYQISDVQFRSSIKFSLGLIVFPVWLFAILAVMLMLLPVLHSFALLFLFTASGLLSLHFRDGCKELQRTAKWYLTGKDKRRELINDLKPVLSFCGF